MDKFAQDAPRYSATYEGLWGSRLYSRGRSLVYIYIYTHMYNIISADPQARGVQERKRYEGSK